MVSQYHIAAAILGHLKRSSGRRLGAFSHCKELQGHFEPEGLAPAPHSLHFGTFDRF